MFYSFDYLLIVIIGIVGIIVQSRLQSVFGKYSKVYFPSGMTGREVAEKMLRDHGITDVKVVATRGHLTDHYNPTTQTVALSESVYNSPSIAAAAVAAHECGHAVQWATGYAPVRLRTALVPIINFASTWSTWIVLIGVFTLATFPAIYWVGIGMIAASTLFSVVTLPVELNASSRALQWLHTSRLLDQQTLPMARKSLAWAARTYVIAALSSVAVLLYYLGFARNND